VGEKSEMTGDPKQKRHASPNEKELITNVDCSRGKYHVDKKTKGK